MDNFTPDFVLEVEGVKGSCPAGEKYAQQMSAEKKIPVLSCEGPCIRGEIARLVANLVAKEVPTFARACHAETFLVPHSSMARWVTEADKAVMIDGCFLQCHGRVLNGGLRILAPVSGAGDQPHLTRRPARQSSPWQLVEDALEHRALRLTIQV